MKTTSNQHYTNNTDKQEEAGDRLEKLCAKMKAIIVEHFKEHGLYQATITDILMAMHINSFEMFSSMETYAKREVKP